MGSKPPGLEAEDMGLDPDVSWVPSHGLDLALDLQDLKQNRLSVD